NAGNDIVGMPYYWVGNQLGYLLHTLVKEGYSRIFNLPEFFKQQLVRLKKQQFGSVGHPGQQKISVNARTGAVFYNGNIPRKIDGSTHAPHTIFRGRRDRSHVLIFEKTL